MFWFVVFLIFLLGTGVTSVVALATKGKPDGVPMWVPPIVFAICLLFLLIGTYRGVGTKEVGVETSFGKVDGHLSAGPHLVLPWIAVHEMDGAIQTDSFVDNASSATCQAIAVRIANQQTGCASVSFQWRIRPAAVDELYKDYRSFDHVRDALVTRKLTAAVNEAFVTYNPLNSIVSGTNTVASAGKNETLIQIAAQVTSIMKREVGKKIEVLGTVLPIVSFDAATQGRINQLQQQVALTRIATQQLATNEAQARANAALAKSVDTSPNILVSRCLDIMDAVVKANQTIPAGFSCWPGGGVAAVIAGPSK